ncbi:MAG: sporulation integral membrane protein YtvI [Thermoanaerobacterales bacterium]|nr:sporulation integral membrane protein YtvI [Thermoanaerobacterales bacterium]
MSGVSPRLQRVVWTAAAVLLVAANAVLLARVAGFALPILAPFIVAALAALFLEPAVRFFHVRLRFPRFLAALTAILLTVGSLGLLVTLGILRLIAELGSLSNALPAYVAALRAFAEGLISRGIVFYGHLPPAVSDYVDNAVKAASQSVESGLATVVNGVLAGLGKLPGAFFIALIILLGTYFFSRDLQPMKELWLRWLPGTWGRDSLDVARQAFNAFRGYLRAQAVLVSISTAVAITGLVLIGSPYAVSLGLLTGFFDLIPVLGPSTVFVPWIVWSVLTGATGFAVKLGIVLGIILVLRQLLEAKVIAMSLGVHPLAVLAAMYIGLKTLGVLGLVIGPILLIIIQAAVKAYLKSRSGL